MNVNNHQQPQFTINNRNNYSQNCQNQENQIHSNKSLFPYQHHNINNINEHIPIRNNYQSQFQPTTHEINQVRNLQPNISMFNSQQNLGNNPPFYYPTYMNNQFQSNIHSKFNSYLIKQHKMDHN